MIKYLRYTNHLRFSLRCHHNKTLDDRRSISRNVASLYILVHDVICLHLQIAISQYHMNGNEKLLETFGYPSNSRALRTGTQSVKPCSNSKSVISTNFHPIFFFFFFRAGFADVVYRQCTHLKSKAPTMMKILAGSILSHNLKTKIILGKVSIGKQYAIT